ncbi:hypothetical protein [Paraburkholderia youngii]|uniref:hypothetical protein n=1 Tax=Paraburkholderia youngii TaxID=2782701 RepID=UPI003D1D5040
MSVKQGAAFGGLNHCQLVAIWDKSADKGCSQGPITRFSSTFEVPLPPSVNGQQHLFIFNGLQSPSARSDRANICPVLRWGIDGQEWSIVGSYVAQSGNGEAAVASKPLLVKPGDRLSSVIELQSRENNRYIYTLRFDSFDSTSLTVMLDHELSLAGFAFEAFNINECMNLPNYSSTIFNSITIEVENERIMPSWSIHNQVNRCGAKIIVEPAGDVDANVIFQYRQDR